MKRVLITGVSGFIGTNLVKYFHQVGNVEVYGHSRKKVNELASLKLVSELSTERIDALNINTIIHLAGIAHDLSNQYKPEDYYTVNTEQTTTLFDAFIQSNATKFIFLSSIKAAVDTSSTPVDEQVIPSPVTHYGKSKLQAEQYILSKKLPDDKRVYIFRPCMIHGPGNKGNLNVLYRFAKTGLPYPFGAFENKRSFLSIDNLNFIVQNFLEKEIPSGIYHLADTGFLSSKELYQLISKELNKKGSVWNIPAGLLTSLFSLIRKRGMLTKLTEDMMVSNAKVLQYLEQPMPIEMRDGLRKTIQSFHVGV